MHWKAIWKRMLQWIGFSVGFMILPVVLSVMMYKVIGKDIEINLYLTEILFISVTLAATSLNDVFSITRKGAKDIFTTFLLIILILIALICISLYMIVSTCLAINQDIDYLLVDKMTLIFFFCSLVISGSCQIFLANIEGEESE